MFDSHLHLTSDRFSEDLDDVIARARAAGVRRMVTVGTDPADARAAVDVARAYRGVVYATAGLHPHDASTWRAAETENALRSLLAAPEVVAVGEAGLDFHYDHSPRDVQLRVFLAQIDLAEEFDLPLIVHSRDADEGTADVLREHAARVRGVLHCFTGGDELLDTALAADWYVSFGGIATFNSFAAPDHVRRVPAERLLIETDSPYLAPVPFRGRRNEPSFLPHTCARLAELRGVSTEELAASSTDAAERFYAIPNLEHGQRAG